MEKKKIRVATYTRIASKNQNSIFNINLALKDLIEEKREDWELIDYAFDYGISGRIMERPGLQYILDLCEEKKIDMLVTLRPAMLARDTVLFMKICEKLKENGIALYFNEKIKSNTPQTILRIDKI